jgi:hypothetical protein
MEWIVSNKRSKTKIAVIVALVAFSTVFLLTGALLTSVYGYEFLDSNVDYGNEIDNAAAQISDACVQERTDNKVVLNDEGLKDNLIAQLTNVNFCDGIVQALLESNEGWYLDSVSFKDGFVEKIMRR